MAVLSLRLGNYISEFGGLFLKIHFHEQFFYRFCSHAYFITAFAVALCVLSFFIRTYDLLFHKIRIARIENYETAEIKHLLEELRTHIEKQPHPARHASEVPYMRHGSSKLNVSHPFSAHLALRYFDSALIAYYAFIPYSLVLAAMTFPVLCRPEDPFAKQTVFFGLLSTVIYRFRLRYFTV